MMMDWQATGRLIIGLGLALVAVGLLVVLVGKLGHVPRVPGDIVVRRPGFTFYAPLGTSLLISLALTLGALLLRYLRK